MGYTTAIISGLSFGLFMAISVGPTLFAVIRYSLNHSYRAGLAFVLGVSLSDIMYVTLANLATPFLRWLQHYERALAYGGGALLLLLGITGFMRKYKPVRPSTKLVSISRSDYFKIFGAGFLINTINPGVVINWLAVVTVLAAKDANGWYRFIFFSCCLGLVLSVDFLKVLLADKIRQKLTLRRVMYLQKASALILFLFGLFLVLATLYFQLSGKPLPGKGG